MTVTNVFNRHWVFEKKHESKKNGRLPAEYDRRSYGRWVQTPSDWPCSSRRHPSTSPWVRGCVQSGRPRSPTRRRSRTSAPVASAAARRTVRAARRSVELVWWAAMTSAAQRWRSCSTSWWCCPELVLLSPVSRRADCLPRSTAPADSTSRCSIACIIFVSEIWQTLFRQTNGIGLGIYLSKKSRLGRRKCRSRTRAPNNVS